ncbi:cytochrome b561 [Chromobacterium alkanivorans]|uniref:cytochrome b n=1 Tax=Chromobacterium alkanivorans TaxID=1071719 RepID=UPI0021686287|nr:cytochrome b/b6 domain-containing protein [Chromobacterium alkanivorans]MCS3803371.1 cytochrome b561 [Chromobacterium alkanivorans]MCS3817519.1 cytochrome b561 [Chromobacterium alkanivorans]MCS3872737.1 cytochrome b561 [Chromobacterium alkanivorans]
METSTRSYPPLAAWLHWICAAVILWAMLSGFALASGALPPAVAAAIPPFNVALTTLLMPVFLLRIVYRASFRMPPPAGIAPAQHRLARRAHALLYLLTCLSLASGWLMMERPVDLFGLLTLPPSLEPGAATRALAKLHFASNVALALLLTGHIGAVIQHQRQGRRLLRRMSPLTG